MRPIEPIEIFISYAHEDEVYKDVLLKHLKLLERNSIIKCWHDRKIAPGAEWSKEIDQTLNRSQIILLLISSDFIASDFCYTKEMPRALELHNLGEAVVIPIILKHYYLEGAPFIHLQCLPKDLRPVEAWNSVHEVMADITYEIRKIVDRFVEKSVKTTYNNNLYCIFTVGSSDCIINGQTVKMNTAPTIANDRVYLPVFYTALALGVLPSNILFDDTAQILTILKSKRVIQIKLNSQTMTIDGVNYQMDCKPELVNGHIMLPVRYIVQSIGGIAAFDSPTLTIVIEEQAYKDDESE